MKPLFIRMGSIGLLAVVMSVPALSQRGTRGTARGNAPTQNAGNSEIAEQRREIREKERAAIAQIGQTLRQALEKAQIDAKTRNPMLTKPRRRKKCRLLVATIKPHSIKSVRKLPRLSLRSDNSTLFLIRRELRKEVLSRRFDQIAA